MLIRVMYQEGQFDMVKAQMLENLLREEKVATFKRADGWVTVGRDPVRSTNRSQSYQGPERRNS